MQVDEYGSSEFETAMNSQRSDRACGEANETPCGEFPSQLLPPSEAHAMGERAILPTDLHYDFIVNYQY